MTLQSTDETAETMLLGGYHGHSDSLAAATSSCLS